MKVKIYEIAKKMGVDNKQVVEIANKNGIEVKSHLSSVTEEEGKMLEKLLKGVFKKKSMENQKEKDEPVIIRREVIFNDDKNEEEEKKKQQKKEQASFNVEKNRKKDYNIVYRNKPTKPLTVSELLGISKKEDKKQEAPKVVKEESKSQKMLFQSQEKKL